MAKLSRLVPAGTPLRENGGDLGSKQDAVPSHEKSTLKLGACAPAGLDPARTASATTAKAARLGHMGRHANTAEVAALEEPGDHRVEPLLVGIGVLAVCAHVSCLVLAPGLDPLSHERRPLVGHIRGLDINEAGDPEIIPIFPDARHGDPEHDLAQVLEICCRKGSALGEILDVASAAGAERPREPRKKSRPVGNVQHCEPAHHSVECGVWYRIAECVATEVRNAPVESAPP